MHLPVDLKLPLDKYCLDLDKYCHGVTFGMNSVDVFCFMLLKMMTIFGGVCA